MTEPPKRRAWFQLRLSTCVLLMVVAGVLLWANVNTYLLPDYSWNVSGDPNKVESPETWRCFAEARGWPRPYRIAASDEIAYLHAPKFLRGERRYGKSTYRVLDEKSPQSKIILTPTDWFDIGMWSRTSVSINAFLALAILGSMAFACEILLRRCERKRTA